MIDELMSDLRETVRQEIIREQETPHGTPTPGELADAAIRVARPIIERELLERLIAETDTFLWSVIEDNDGCTVPVDDWFRSKLDTI